MLRYDEKRGVMMVRVWLRLLFLTGFLMAVADIGAMHSTKDILQSRAMQQGQENAQNILQSRTVEQEEDARAMPDFLRKRWWATKIYRLMSQGRDLSDRSEELYPFIIHAVKMGDTEIVRYALEHGAQVDMVKNEMLDEMYACREILYKRSWVGTGITPLMAAIETKNSEMVQLLLRYKADSNRSGDYGLLPLVSAVNNRSKHIVQLLLDNGANIDQMDDGTYGLQSPLISAVVNGDRSMVQLLIDHKADINARDDEGRSAVAVILGNAEGINKKSITMLDMLLDQGIEVNSVDRNEATALTFMANLLSSDRLDVHVLCRSEFESDSESDTDAVMSNGLDPQSAQGKLISQVIRMLLCAGVHAYDVQDYGAYARGPMPSSSWNKVVVETLKELAVTSENPVQAKKWVEEQLLSGLGEFLGHAKQGPVALVMDYVYPTYFYAVFDGLSRKGSGGNACFMVMKEDVLAAFVRHKKAQDKKRENKRFACALM